MLPNFMGKGTPQHGPSVKYTMWENLRFSTEVAVYLGNGARPMTAVER